MTAKHIKTANKRSKHVRNGKIIQSKWKPRSQPGPRSALERAILKVLIKRPQATVDDAYRRAKAALGKHPKMRRIRPETKTSVLMGTRNFPRHKWKPTTKNEWQSEAYVFNASRWEQLTRNEQAR